jgi:hypothetical protein
MGLTFMGPRVSQYTNVNLEDGLCNFHLVSHP